eukprot:scaffold110230_cov66-Phaeocystis_antarctica.AAC.1
MPWRPPWPRAGQRRGRGTCALSWELSLYSLTLDSPTSPESPDTGFTCSLLINSEHSHPNNITTSFVSKDRVADQIMRMLPSSMMLSLLVAGVGASSLNVAKADIKEGAITRRTLSAQRHPTTGCADPACRIH